MPTMTGGEAIVAALLKHDVDTVFGLPGAQIYGLFDALHRAQPNIKTIGARHEQACSYMAFGYARSTGRPGIYSVVPGPGMLNAAAGALTAFGCNAPILCLTGQVPTAFIDKRRGHLHEMPDQLSTMRGFMKWAERIEHPSLAGQVVARAFQEMRSGRQGPAAVEMPWDVFMQKAQVQQCEKLSRLPNPAVDTDRLDDAARLIRDSKAPMIFVGSGAMDAGDSILELAETIDAPVVAFRSGRGIVSNAHELGLTIAGAYNLWPETDLMIGIGTRLEVPCWRWPYRPAGQKVIRIDIDPAEMRRFVPDVGIVADAAEATGGLVQSVRKLGFARTNRREAIRAAAAKAEKDVTAIQPQVAYLQAIREVLPADGLVTDEISQMGFASWYGFPVYKPRTFISSGYQGTLGSGFPTALGVKVAHPNKPVVAITGDGGFMFAAQELATAAQFNIGVATCVFNNNAFGNVRRDQRVQFDGRVLGANLDNPDFVKFAESFGVHGVRVDTPQAFKPALEKALSADKPCLIEVVVPRDSESDPWRFIHPPKP